VSFSGKGHAPPLVIAKPLLREASVRLEISRPHTTQVGWPEPRRMLGPQAALPTSKHTMLFHRYWGQYRRHVVQQSPFQRATGANPL